MTSRERKYQYFEKQAPAAASLAAPKSKSSMSPFWMDFQLPVSVKLDRDRMEADHRRFGFVIRQAEYEVSFRENEKLVTNMVSLDQLAEQFPKWPEQLTTTKGGKTIETSKLLSIWVVMLAPLDELNASFESTKAILDTQEVGYLITGKSANLLHPPLGALASICTVDNTLHVKSVSSLPRAAAVCEWLSRQCARNWPPKCSLERPPSSFIDLRSDESKADRKVNSSSSSSSSSSSNPTLETDEALARLLSQQCEVCLRTDGCKCILPS